MIGQGWSINKQFYTLIYLQEIFQYPAVTANWLLISFSALSAGRDVKYYNKSSGRDTFKCFELVQNGEHYSNWIQQVMNLICWIIMSCMTGALAVGRNVYCNGNIAFSYQLYQCFSSLVFRIVFVTYDRPSRDYLVIIIAIKWQQNNCLYKLMGCNKWWC